VAATEALRVTVPALEPIASEQLAAASFVDRFDELHRRAYESAFKLLGDRHESEDIAQESCARASLRWNRLDNVAVIDGIHVPHRVIT
jgi:DNA-directed RNA polymerase specialized sigma24 family protein